MDKLQFISNNLLIAGETGSGKTYFLKYLINQILETYEEKSIVYICDLKSLDYIKTINNTNILKYNEEEISKLVDDRLTKLKENPTFDFSDVYVIFDELTDALAPWDQLLKNRSNKKRVLNDHFIELLTSSISKKIKVYMICATQLPNLLLPSEIKSKFNWYIDIFYDTNANSDDRYSSLLKTELDSSFNEIFHTNFDERYLTIYEIEGNDKYIVNKNNEVVIETSDYMLGYSKFIEAVKKIINDNFGFFGDVGLPYSLEAYLCVDDEICNNNKLIKKADEILNLFKQIQTFDGSIVQKNYLRDIRFSNEEWTFELNAKDGLVKVKSNDDIHYLETNIFSNLEETNQLYFKFCLIKVISEPTKISKLGGEMRYKISLNRMNVLKFEVDHFKKEFSKKINFKKLNEGEVNECLKKALSDALNQGARRNKVEYKKKLNAILSSVKNDLFAIATGRIIISDANDYKKHFLRIKDAFFNALRSNDLGMLATFGFAQKFISMSFKYLYCFDDCVRKNLRFCYLPLDQYTIDWYKKYGSKSLINRFKSIKFAWSNIDETLYLEIQSDIDSKLKSCLDYEINCKDSKQRIQLPQSKIEVEFIVWKQEQLNEFSKKLSKFKDYFERLGIKAI